MNFVVLAVALPLLAGFLTPALGRSSRALAQWLGWGTLAVCIGVLWVAWARLDGGTVAIAIGGFRPPLGIVFYLDAVALLFGLAVPLMALLLWPREGTPQQFALTLVLTASATGLALSGDIFNLYVFYELTAAASFGLIAGRGTGAAQGAALRYLLLSAAGSVLLLAGITIVYLRTGTLNLAHLATLAPERLQDPVGLAAFALMLIGLGVKGELFPVNGWVPEVYGSVSGRLAGLLAGLVSKLAVLVVVRILVLIFPQPEAAQLMLVLGMLGIVAGELAAWRARDLRRQFAFSSIGQLGIVFVAFSVPGEAGIVAGLAVALHHLLVKPALFLLAERWGGSIEGLRGAGRGHWLASGLFILFALSLVGLPPLPGFWAKLLTVMGLMGLGTGLAWLGALTVMAATVVEAAYLFRTLSVLLAREAGYTSPGPHRGLDLVTASLAGLVLVGSVFALHPLGDGLKAMAAQAADVQGYIRTVLGDRAVARRGQREDRISEAHPASRGSDRPMGRADRAYGWPAGSPTRGARS
ncbi:MAG TPA: NADH-quinone oxidoreductase subunit J [Chromatiales bacterium]|nr:NADH-quinone oxidoreductase subunit J [Chromatiales bacterium]